MDLVIDEALSVLVYLTGAFVLLLVGKIVFRVFNPNAKIDYELVENDNPAFAISYVGYFAALIITFSGVILGESQGLGKDLIDMLIFGLLSIVLLNSSVIISNRWILPRFDAKSEILQKRNVACAIVVAGVAISNGIIIMGAVYGDGEIFPQAFYTTLVCWACGQVILLLFTRVYNFVTPYDIHPQLQDGNQAAAWGYFGVLVAVGNIVRFGLMVDFTGWFDLFENLLFGLVLGIVLLPLVRFLADRLLLPGRNLTAEIVPLKGTPNVGAGLVESFAYMASSVLIVWAL